MFPKHVGIIMDGNRRWARLHGLPTLEGHRRGYNVVKKVSQWCDARGIKNLTVFAFSTENWDRSKTEVSYLLKLFRQMLRREIGELVKRGVRLNIFGRLEGLSQSLRKEISQAMGKTKKNTRGVLNIAFNYGGRAEIVDAVKKIIVKNVPPEQVTEKLVTKNMYLPQLPDPDLIIRTSGELRTSGFLLWESAYSELLFTNKYWPEFSEADFDAALNEYAGRKRRFGK